MRRTKTAKSRLRQPPSSFANCTELSDDENIGKDFGTLINAPLSKDGHFVFKSEKTWSVDPSQHSQLFTLNLKLLSATIDCIPFNEYVDIDNKYFTSDQLTSIYNDAEKGRLAYDTILDDLNELSSCDENKINDTNRIDQSKQLEPIVNATSQSQENSYNIEEDLESLLSIKEPMRNILPTIMQSTSHNNDYKPRSNIPTKSMDLEKWLDSILDD